MISKIPYTIRFIIFGVVFLLLIGIALFFLFSQDSRPQPPKSSLVIPTPIIPQAEYNRKIESNLNPLQKTVIGKTTDQELLRIPNITQESLSQGLTKYSFPSEFVYWPNEVVTQNGVVIFERIVLPERSESLGYDTVSGIENKFGSAENIIPGSKRYSEVAKTYVYPSQGFAVVGFPHDDKIYEIQKFLPTTLEVYKTFFGDDLNPNAQPEGEKPL